MKLFFKKNFIKKKYVIVCLIIFFLYLGYNLNYYVYDYIYDNLTSLQERKVALGMFLSKLFKDKICSKYNIHYNHVTNGTITFSKNNIYYNNREINPIGSDYIVSNKYKCNAILKNNDIDIPKSYLWNNDLTNNDNLKRINKLLSFPLVVKDNFGERGKDVYLNITSNSELMKYVNKIRNNYDTDIIIEEQVALNKYRIFVLYNKIIYIQYHNNPEVIGDGSQNVDELIKEYPNKSVRKLMGGDDYKIKYIDHKLIKNQGYELNDILEKGKTLTVTNVAGRSNGSVAYDIDISKVPKCITNKIIYATKILNLNIAGVDYLTNDITSSKFGKILEINARPGFTWSPNIDYNIHRLVETLFPNQNNNIPVPDFKSSF